MKLARYMGQGRVEIVDEAEPICPPGGLLIQTEACGLCSGELMDWYMDKKIPHVLGHEVAGRVIESQDPQFPVGSRVFPHHHAPCLNCNLCRAGHYVHCPQWKRTRLQPGGMAERFGVTAENLTDTLLCNDLSPQDAALIEPLACVIKSLRAGQGQGVADPQCAVIGLGAMGLLHLLMLPPNAIGYDINPCRVAHANTLNLRTGDPQKPQTADVIFVCPGSQNAFDSALRFANPGATIVMFAPLAPGLDLRVPQQAYFHDLSIKNSYSCGPTDTSMARDSLRNGTVKSAHVVSDFVRLEALPEAYLKMKRGEILKPMVQF